jgi:hypothetical protein
MKVPEFDVISIVFFCFVDNFKNFSESLGVADNSEISGLLFSSFYKKSVAFQSFCTRSMV